MKNDSENKKTEDMHETKHPIGMKSIRLNWLIFPMLLSVPFLLVQFLFISSFYQLPGPVYGGDIYWHYGRTMHIALGEAPWSNPQVAGEYEYYGWLTPWLIAVFLNIIQDLFHAYLYFALIQAFAGIMAFYYLGYVFFRNKYAALLLSFLGAASGLLYQPSIGGTGGIIMMPLFLAFLYKSFTENGIKNRIFAGLFFGLASLAHVNYFPSIIVLLTVIFIYMSFFRNWKFKFLEGKFYFSTGKTEMKSAVKSLWLMVIIGIIISMAFWGPIIFVYHGKVENPVNEYANADLSKFGLVIGYEMVSGFLFNIGSLLSLNIYGFAYSIIVLLALYIAFKTQDIKSRFFIAMFIAALLGGLHYFITMPLFGTSAIPTRVFDALASPLSALLFVSGVVYIYNFVKDKRIQKIIAAVVIMVLIYNVSVNNLNNDQWVKVGKNPDFAFSEIAEWTKQNTNINDIFLSHQELSFAINSIAARKVMVSRRTHFSPYMDIDLLLADSAIILYGNNEPKRIELLKEYGIKYLYWDVNWLRFAAESEPILVSPEYASYLEQNNVTFRRVNFYLDPAFSQRSPRYDLLAIGPVRNDPVKPWSPQLDSHLELAKEFRLQNQVFAVIYKIL